MRKTGKVRIRSSATNFRGKVCISSNALTTCPTPALSKRESSPSGWDNSPRSMKLEQHLNHLRKELEVQWNKFSIPESHRYAFLKLVLPMSIQMTCAFASEELRALKAQVSAFQLISAAVKQREYVLDKLREQSIGFNKVEAVQWLIKLRLASLEVAESIKHWRCSYQNTSLIFYHDDKDYLLKMRKDFQFVLAWNDSIKFPQDTSTFFNYSRSIKNIITYKDQVMVPMPYSMVTRLNAAEEMLKVRKPKSPVFRSPKKKKVSQTEVSHIAQGDISSYLMSSDESLIRSSQASSLITEIEVPIELCNEILDLCINSIVSEEFPDVIIACSDEMIAAALVLFSSSVLDKYITEVLSSLIVNIANQAYQEVIDVEYIELQERLIMQVCESEMADAADSVSKTFIAELILEKMSRQIEHRSIVEEALTEEIEWNKRILVYVYEGVLEEMLQHEWLELLVDETAEEIKHNHMWSLLPVYIQHQIYKSNPSVIHDKIAEMLYWDILHDIVAGYWVDGILAYCESDDISLDLLMPIPDYQEQRKAVKNRIQFGLKKCI